MTRCRGIVIATPGSAARGEATWRSIGTQGVRRSLDCCAIARRKMGVLDALWLTMTALARITRQRRGARRARSPTGAILLSACSGYSNASSARSDSGSDPVDARYYGLVEMLLSFGVVLAFCFWQLYSVAKAKRKRLERERAERGEV